MRRTFFDLLKDSEVDVNTELRKLNDLFRQDCCYYRGKSFSLYDLVSSNFAKYYKRREHFLYSEMYIDLITLLDDLGNEDIESQKQVIKYQIEKVISSLGYKFIVVDDRQIIVENNVFANEAAQAVTEFADVKEALSILEYNHFSNKGNIERKKEILKKIADLLEPWRKPLNKSNELKALLKVNHDKIRALEKLFYMYNKFNIRHNNEDQMLTELSDKEIESWYDKVYKLSLFIILGKDVGSILSDFEVSFCDNK